MLSLCDHWEFTESWFDGFATGEGQGKTVRLPHTTKELPQHYADHRAYQMICGYRKNLELGENLTGKRIFLQFDGAGHIATVFVNGQELTTHRCGYTAFRVDVTDAVNLGGENILAVKLDATENGSVPPFGFVIDYLTYGGLYREVWLDIREESYIEDIYVTTPALDQLRVQVTAANSEDCNYQLTLTTLDGKLLQESTYPASSDPIVLYCSNVKPWTCENPQRYLLTVKLVGKDSRIFDTQSEKIGFRTAQFKTDGFYLNGKKTFMRGLNRHQCWPYVGYAVPESLQREDARILKEELGCNAVRTSHYPQSQYFIDECDRLGLLVFTEIPGWQHIGDGDWQNQACENVKEMVLQYRNHPSIILWGVRINESQDNDALYRRTNAIAHELDPSRATSGVRCILKSSLLEDVYAYNDFSHEGNNPGARKKLVVTPDQSKALLISEHSGHIFPTKSFDPWAKRQDHALRHARVLDAAYGSGEHAGCFGWCMFDYNTHKDFGSGDRICYHGVLDAFRNPKPAAYTYASQNEEKPVLFVTSSMDIGDYSASMIGEVYVLTNGDEVDLYKNNTYVTTLKKTEFPSLPHGPITVDDTVGQLLETQEHFPKAKAELLRKCLLAASKRGLNGMTIADKALMAKAMVTYGLTIADATALYGKYIGNWGGEFTVWRFDAKKNGKVIASTVRCPGSTLHLEVTPSNTQLKENDSYDMAAVRIRVLDEYGNGATYAQLPVKLAVEGAAELVGPDVVTAEGGMCGTYIRTTGESGSAILTVSAPGLEEKKVVFTIA